MPPGRSSMKYEHSLDHIPITFYYIHLFSTLDFFSLNNQQNRMFYSIKLLINTCLYLKYYLTISNLRHVLWSSIWTKCCQWRFMISHKNESSKHCDIFFPPCPHITGYSLWTGTFFDLTDDDWISMTILLKFLALEHISMFLCRYR